MHTIKTFIIAHKIITTIGIAAVLGGGYWEYKNLTNTSNETPQVLESQPSDFSRALRV